MWLHRCMLFTKIDSVVLKLCMLSCVLLPYTVCVCGVCRDVHAHMHLCWYTHSYIHMCTGRYAYINNVYTEHVYIYMCAWPVCVWYINTDVCFLCLHGLIFAVIYTLLSPGVHFALLNIPIKTSQFPIVFESQWIFQSQLPDPSKFLCLYLGYNHIV